MLKERIKEIVEEKIQGLGCFLVDVKISPSKVMVFIDRLTGIKIEDCVEVSRFIQEKLEGTDVMEYHELEVSSPGMDEPLKVPQQYQKRIGREINVVTFDGLKHNGILKGITELDIELEEKIIRRTDGKKERIFQTNRFPFSRIKETTVVFSFDKTIK